MSAVLLSLNLANSDQGIREYIRGDAPLQMRVQRVICQDARYADATYAAWVNRKIANGLSCGGGWSERYIGPIVRVGVMCRAASGSPEAEKS